MSLLNQFVGPLQCQPFSWTVQEAKEPFYFNDNSNSPLWVRYSPDFYMDFSDPRILSLKAGNGSALSGILIMMKPGENINITGGTGTGIAVTFALPNNCILFGNTEGNFCQNSTPFRNATVQKTITEVGTSNSIIIPLGNNTNVGHGDYRLFDYATYGTGDPIVQTTYNSNFTLRYFSTGVLKTLLQSNSFITANNIFRCKFAHIITGIGHCYIRNMSCDANC